MATNPILEVRNLHVEFETFEGTAEVINGVDFTLERGQTSALVGETGCGKSVTIKAILGLLPEANIPEGEIIYDGTDLLSLSEEDHHSYRGQEVSMIMQNPMNALNPVFTVGEQMVDMLKWQGKRRLSIVDWARDRLTDGTKYREQAIEMLDDVEISASERVFESYPHELSGGMRQRVLIAMALLSEPNLLIADEPGTALDVTTEAKVLSLLDDLVQEKNTTVLYITHDLGVANEVANFVNVMYAGEIVEQAPTKSLFQSPKHPYTRALLDSIPKLATGMGAGIPGQVASYTDPPPACRFVARCPYAEEACNEVYPYKRWADEGHAVACHLYEGGPVEDRHADLHQADDTDMVSPLDEESGQNSIAVKPAEGDT